MPVHFTILGSGSTGNCAYLETGETRILIDAGLSGRQIRQRLAMLSRTPETLHGILITHEHGDHVQGLTTIAAKLHIPVYCNRLTKEAITEQLKVSLEFRVFDTGASFEVGDVAVETFSIPHDAMDPVGFMLRTPGGNLGFLTDLGHATSLVLQRVKASHALVLEANHDVKMLQDDPHRPWSLKQRILSRHGHLSNEAAAVAAEAIVSGDLSHLFLGHLSRDCNRPQLAQQAVQRKLEGSGARHVQIAVASQDTPCATLRLSR